ncbi:MAG: ABC transporter permease, partial [Terriglobales bacterium]
MLTALGMVFGVGAVIGMLAIGAGAKQQALATIEALGVHNLMVDSIPPGSPQELQQRRMTSPGLTMRDVRIVEANLAGLSEISPRRSLQPQKLLPQPTQAMPTLEGVDPSFAAIHDFHELDGSFFDQLDNAASVPAAVLGQSAKVSLFGYTPAVGKYIKVNDAWLRVVGVLDEQLNGSGTGKDWNNVIFTPLNTFNNRFYDNSFTQKDFLDGVDMSLKPDANSVAAAAVVTAILNSTHHDTDDFNVTVPAALLAQKQQTQRIFTLVMVAVAAISLLVGGIGIMNIVLATVME